jgi:hypothetical protein
MCGGEKMKKLTEILVLTVVFLVIPVFGAMGGQGGKPTYGAMEFMLFEGKLPNFPPPPPEYAAAGGKVKYTLTGPILEYTLKAYGLVPGEEYHVRTCGDVIGVGAADEDGEIRVSGSASGPYHDIQPYDVFTIRLAEDSSSIILITDEHGFEWN